MRTFHELSIAGALSAANASAISIRNRGKFNYLFFAIQIHIFSAQCPACKRDLFPVNYQLLGMNEAQQINEQFEGFASQENDFNLVLTLGEQIN